MPLMAGTDGTNKGHLGEAAARTGTSSADWGTTHACHVAIWVLTVPIGTLLCCEKRRAAPNAMLARDVHKMHVSNAQPLNT